MTLKTFVLHYDLFLSATNMKYKLEVHMKKSAHFRLSLSDKSHFADIQEGDLVSDALPFN